MLNSHVDENQSIADSELIAVELNPDPVLIESNTDSELIAVELNPDPVLIESNTDSELIAVELNPDPVLIESNTDSELNAVQLNSDSVLNSMESNVDSTLNAVELNSDPILNSMESNADSKMSMIELNSDPLLNSVELNTDSKLNAVELNSDLILDSDDPVIESNISFVLSTEESDANTSLNESFSLHYYSNDDDTMSLSSVSQEIDYEKYITPEPEELQLCDDVTTKVREIDNFVNVPDWKKTDEKSQEGFIEQRISEEVETEKGLVLEFSEGKMEIPESQHTDAVCGSDTSVHNDQPVSSHKNDVTTTTTTMCVEQCSPLKLINNRSLSPQIHLVRTTPSKTPSPIITKPEANDRCVEQVTKGRSETRIQSRALMQPQGKRRRRVKEYGEVSVARQSSRITDRIHEMCAAKERQTRRISSKSKENELTKKVHVLHTRLRTTQPSKASPKHTEPVKPVEQVSKGLSETELVRPLSRRRKIQETSSSSAVDIEKQRRSRNTNETGLAKGRQTNRLLSNENVPKKNKVDIACPGIGTLSGSKIQSQKHKADTKPVKLVEQVTKGLPKTKLVTRKKKKGYGWSNMRRRQRDRVLDNSFSKRRQTTTQKMLNKDSEKISCNRRHSLTKSEEQSSSASSLESDKKATTSLYSLRTGSKENVIKSSHSSAMSKRPKKRPRETPTESNTTQKEGNHDNHSPSSGTENKDKKDAKNIDGNADDGSKRRAPKRRRLSRRSDESSSSLKNWKCAFCGFGNNEKFLGYLFGPYSCNVNVEEEGDNGEDKEKEMEDEKGYCRIDG